jgi:hypothetical protein
MDRVDVAKLTKLERFDIDRADRLGYLSALSRFTNLLSLDTDGGHLCTSLLANLLPHFPLLQELKTPLDTDVLADYKGAYLTKLDASGCSSFDARYIEHFCKLELLYLRSAGDLINTDALTQLTCLTALTMAGRGVSKSDLKVVCCLTQLKYLEVSAIAKPMKSLSNLCNLTRLKCFCVPDWTKTIAPMTALQRIDAVALDARSFTSQHCSTLTHLAYYRSNNQSPVFDLTALQSLNINISPDYAVHKIDKGLVNATKRLMPAVQVVWSGGHQQKLI